MKKLLFIALAIVITSVSNSQPWTESLPKLKSNESLSLTDYQKSFNEYWAPFNLDRGYYLDNNGDTKKARGWKQFRRWEYYWETQVDAETGAFPATTASKEFQQYIQSKSGSVVDDQSDWVNLGTSYSYGGYAGIGRVNCIAFHPSDNNTYWVGTPSGGLWVTYNNGEAWAVLTDENSVLGISDIVVPSDYDLSKTIFIATGDRDAWDNRSVGVLKSTDAGETWSETGLSYTVQQGVMSSRLLLDPDDDRTIIAATSSGVYKTTDGGVTWNNRLTSTYFIDMEYKPGDFSTLYGSTSGGLIYLSNDSGETWEIVLSSSDRAELAVSPANPELVYAVIADDDDYGLYAVYKSVNSGLSYDLQLQRSTMNLLGWSRFGNDEGGQGWYDLSIAVSPTNEDMVFIGGVNTWRSIDGGDNYSIMNHWSGDGAQEVHADKHMLTYRSNGDLFECNDGGIYISTDNGVSWVDKTDGIVNSQMYKLGVSQQLSNEVITGLQDNGTKVFSGNIWYDVKGGDGMDCLIDYSDYKIQYGSYVYGQITRTSDWWNTTTDIEPEDAGEGAWLTPFIIDPVTPSTLYAGYSDVWKTTDRGNNWSKISSISLSDNIRSMAISSSDNQVLFVADPYDIYKTIDGGSSWLNVSNNLPTNRITNIAIKHDDPETVWVTLGSFDSNAVYESTDGGATWANISSGLPNIPANSIVQDKSIDKYTMLYVGTEAGVFSRSRDDDWQLFNTGLPNVKVGELEIYYNDDLTESRLRAATYGRGLWETPMILNVGVLEISEIASETYESATITASLAYGEDSIVETGFVYSRYSDFELDDKYTKKIITNPLVIDGEFTLTLSNLVNGTYYYVKAYAKTEYGVSYSDDSSFVTACGGVVSELPAYQEFSVDSLPACWDTYSNNGNEMLWQFINSGNLEFSSSTSANGFASIDSKLFGTGTQQNTSLETPEYNFSTIDKVNLIFEHEANLQSGSLAELYYTSDSGTSWSLLESWDSIVGVNNSADYFIRDISDEVAGNAEVAFKWSYQGEDSSYWCIDDLLIDTLNVVHVNVVDTAGNSLNDILVTVGDNELTTNFNGDVMYKSVSRTTYNYMIQGDGYIEQLGQFEVSDENIFLNIQLQPIPSTDAFLSDLQLDSITIDDFSLTTYDYSYHIVFGDTNIPAVLAEVHDEKASMEITQADENNLLATVKVTAEDEVTIRSYRIAFEYGYDVTFNVLNSGIPIQNATIEFVDSVKLTDEQGSVTFSMVEVENDVIFEITTSGYNDYLDSVSVVDKDVTVNIQLTPVGVDEIELKNVNVYPNPASRLLNIELPDGLNSGQLILIDASGKIVVNENVFNQYSINIDYLPHGFYLLQVSSEKGTYSEKIIIE